MVEQQIRHTPRTRISPRLDNRDEHLPSRRPAQRGRLQEPTRNNWSSGQAGAWGGRMFRAEGEDISFIYFSEISLRILGYFSKFLCPNQNIFAPAVRQV